MNWKEITKVNPKSVKVFQLEDEPELIYLIKIRKDEFLVVYNDAYDLKTGQTEFLNSNDLKEKYNINL
jgi:hypothetical protein